MQGKYKSISMQRKVLCSLVAVSLCWGAAPALVSSNEIPGEWDGKIFEENIDINE